MENKKPVSIKMELSCLTGETLLKLLTLCYMENSESDVFAYTMRTANIYSIPEGKSFLDSRLSIRKVKEQMKQYNINFLYEEQKDCYQILIGIDDFEIFKSGFTAFMNDITDSNKMYLLFQSMILTLKNMSFKERLAYYEKQVDEEIELKRKRKK